jgi:hypothetical protein
MLPAINVSCHPVGRAGIVNLKLPVASIKLRGDVISRLMVMVPSGVTVPVAAHVLEAGEHCEVY